MDVIRKDATITNTDDTFPGSFEVILSAPTKDRDGDTLLSDEWKMPLPEHITFDSDHGMSVATTVGSGTPSIDASGNLVVSGTYSSLGRAQEVRTLVNEGHIRTTSVAFMSEKSGTKDGKPSTVRELLNGAFVAIPSNREALVLASKALDVKAGARNSISDAAHIQAIHDHAVALGAGPMDDTGAEVGAPGGKSVEGAETKAVDPDADPAGLAQAVDAAIDEAQKLIAQVDVSTLPAEIQQAVSLITAAEVAVDELLEALGAADPDDMNESSEETTPPAAEKSADVDALDLQYRALSATLTAYTAD